MSNEKADEKIVTQYVNGHPYRLKEAFDLSFVEELGKVFAVFDEQDSGNLLFGLRIGNEPYLLKIAGAPTIKGQRSPKLAVEGLRKSVRIYQALASAPQLVKLVRTYEFSNCFALLFHWVEGHGLYRGLTTAVTHSLPEELSATPIFGLHSVNGYKAFKHLPHLQRCQVAFQITNFFCQIASKNYIAVDFYDGSLLYDFTGDILHICDIDDFREGAFTNQEGRLPGSTRFMAPEEFTRGALIDERTNVFRLGKMLYFCFGDESINTLHYKNATTNFTQILGQCVHEDPDLRYASTHDVRDALIHVQIFGNIT